MDKNLLHKLNKQAFNFDWQLKIIVACSRSGRKEGLIINKTDLEKKQELRHFIEMSGFVTKS